MDLILPAGLLLALGVWIALPLFRRRIEQFGPAEEELNRLLDAKQAVFRSILDLEFDLKVDKVSLEDHDLMRKRHEAEAIQILKQLEALQGVRASDLIEREIAEARKRLQ